MHVTIIGAGTLGRVYGLRLLAAGDEVAFVVRPARVEETSPSSSSRSTATTGAT